MVEPLAESSDLLRTLEERCNQADSPRPFAPLAEAKRLSGDAEGAVRLARRGLESFPGHLAIRLVLARALHDLGDLDGALEEYAFVRRHDPDNVEAASHLEDQRAKPDAGPAPDEPLRGSLETEPAAAPPEPGQETDRTESEPAAGRPSTEPSAEAGGTRESTPSESDVQAHSLSLELEHLNELFANPEGPGEGPPEVIATLTLAEIYARQGLIEKAVEVCEAILRREPDDDAAALRLAEYRKRLASVDT